MKLIFAFVLIAIIAFIPISVRAELKEDFVEIGPFVGYNFFQTGQNLKDKPKIGGRLSYTFTKNLSVEVSVGHIKTRVDDQNISGSKEGQFRNPIDIVHLKLYQLDAIYHFLPDKNFNPFVSAGLGIAKYTPKISTKSMTSYNIGIGAKYWIDKDIVLRIDLKDSIVTEFFKGTYHNIGLTAGISFAFGNDELY